MSNNFVLIVDRWKSAMASRSLLYCRPLAATVSPRWPESYAEVLPKIGDAHLNLERLIHLGDSRSKKAQLAEHSPQAAPLDSLCSFTGSSDHALNTEHYSEGDITEH